MQFDQVSNLTARTAVNTAVIATNTTTAGLIIDTQAFNALTFLLNLGARTDGSYSLAITHGDDAALADSSVVDASDLVGTPAATAVAVAQGVSKIGYVGNKRYVRASIVSTGVTTGATVGALAVLTRPTVGPV